VIFSGLARNELCGIILRQLLFVLGAAESKFGMTLTLPVSLFFATPKTNDDVTGYWLLPVTSHSINANTLFTTLTLFLKIT